MIRSNTFISWFFNEFVFDSLWTNMTETSEASKWHREQTVAIHTNMVVGEYLAASPSFWSHNDLLGALACAFHDVGKPNARVQKHSEERGTYYAYSGHEILSARLWEDWIVGNWSWAEDRFGLEPADIYKVSWAIEHHRPWGLKDVRKRLNLYTTACLTLGIEAYTRMLKADNWGRIGDTQAVNQQQVTKWVYEFLTMEEQFSPIEWSHIAPLPIRRSTDARPHLFMLIGCSGSGKSTYSSAFPQDRILSWDQLRLDWYDEDYTKAFEMSTDDPQFMNKAQSAYRSLLETGDDIVVDNVNTSAKRRRQFITEAQQKGYHTVGVVFPSAWLTILGRRETRTDKVVPYAAVRSQYMNTQQPQYGEFDEIQVHPGNL